MVASRIQAMNPVGRRERGPDWLHGAIEEFKEDLLNPEYPCHFGRTATKRGDMLVAWTGQDEPRNLPSDLRAFLKLTKETPNLRRPLAVFVQPPAGTESQTGYDERFWSILRYLRDHDEVPRPDDVPVDPADPGWEFSFAGESIFVFAMSPANVMRKSRNVCRCLVLVFQTRSVFRGIEVGSPAGDIARSRIRARLSNWDTVDRHPSMGAHDIPSDDEWRQYFITDQNVDIHSRCPLAHGPPATGATS